MIAPSRSIHRRPERSFFLETGLGRRPHPKWALFLLEFATGAVLVLFLHYANLSSGRMLLLGVPAAIGLSVVLSVVTFHSFSRMTAFVPTLLGILIFELLEHVHHKSIFRIVHAKP
jgi:Methyltransferase domain